MKGSSDLPTPEKKDAKPEERRGAPVAGATMRGRLVTAALDAIDRADTAEGNVARATYLAALDRRLSGSLDESLTRETIAQVALPERDAWAVVDLAAADGTPVRLAVVHPDPAKQVIADTLNVHWVPRDDDPIGLPAVKRAGRPISLVDGVDAALTAAAHSTEDLVLLRELGFCACLVVPIRTESEVDGAITFVSAHPRKRFTPEEIELAEAIAAASAHALRNARLFSAINERRSAAEQSNRSRTDALGHVTHELRTPLNAIGGYAQLLSLGVRGPVNKEQLKDLERIRWNQRHLLGLITEILSFVRADTRRIVYTLGSVDFAAVARAAADMIGPIFDDKDQRVVFEDSCGPHAAVAWADAERVRQIIINLMTNASKYSPAGSVVAVRCGVAAAKAFVEISDTGNGISKDQLEAIFEPFVQLAVGSDNRRGGVGLGLAIARQFARGMNGDLTVESQLDVGSTFRLTLPSVRERPAASE
jgi:signal transduction histidine kinase